MYEISRVCVQKYVINVFDEETNKQYLALRKIPYTKAKSWSLPLSSELYKKQIFGEDYNFDMLSFYIQSVRRVGQVHRELELQGYSDDEKVRENYYQIMNNRKKRIAKVVIGRYELTTERLILFLKFLCEKYFRYEDKGLLKLSHMLRFDIIYLRNLLQDGFNLSNIEIEKMLGEIPFKHHLNPLRYIFLGESAEARQDSFSMFKDFIDRTFVMNKIEIKSEEFEDFLSFLDENDMDTIYVTIRDYYYLPSDYRKYRNPISNLATLVVYFESYLRLLISNNPNNHKPTKKNNNTSLLNLLDNQVLKKKEFNKLKSLWKNYATSVTNKNINEIEDKILKTNYDKDEKLNEIFKVFLLIGAIRNYIAHDFFQFYKSIKHYDIYFKFIISAFWYCWKQSKSNEDNNSKQNPITST